MGHESLLAPVLVTELLPVVLPNRLPDALLLTSARALAALTPDQTHSLATCPVYAVGRRTAEAARRRGFKDVRVGGPDAPGLARLLVLTARPGARLLYLAGRVRKPEMESALRGWGYDLSVLDTYDAAEAPPWDERVRRALDGGCLDACLHYSRRSAELALRFADQAAVAQPFRALRHVCISRVGAAGFLRGRSNDRRRSTR